MDKKRVLSSLKKEVLVQVVKYLPSKLRLKLFSVSKLIQKKLSISIYTYFLFTQYVKHRVRILHHKDLAIFYEKYLLKFKDASLDDIENGLCYCIMHSSEPHTAYSIDFSFNELFGVYRKMQKEFFYDVNISINKEFFEFFEVEENYLSLENFIETSLFTNVKISVCGSGVSGLEAKLKRSETFAKIFDLLKPKVTSISFSLCKAKINIPLLFSSFNCFTEVKEVFFGTCEIQPSIANQFLSFLSRLKKMECLSLVQNKIKDETILDVLQSEELSGTLQEIRIEGKKPLSQQLKLGKGLMSSLRLLALKSLGICKVDRFSFQAFLNLKKVDLSNNMIDYSNLKEIFSWDNDSLEVLNLSDNKISSPQELSKTPLKCNLTKLKSLNLSRNKLCEEVLTFVFSVPSLKRLDVSETCFSDSLMKESVKLSESRIEELWARKNEVSSNFGVEILKRLKRLEKLNLFKTKVDDSFAEFLISQKENILIKYVDIELCLVSENKKKQVLSLYNQLVV